MATDARGYITVNDDLSTSVPGIWALGDCNGRGAFTHTAYNDFEIVAANLLDGEHRAVGDRVPAYALYVDPPLGRVGMTDAQAQASGRKLLVGKRPMSRVGRAIEKGETRGFMKVVADASDEEDPWRGDTRDRRRRSHSRSARHHQRRRDIRRAATSGPDSSDGVRVDSDTALRDETGRVSTCQERRPDDRARLAWTHETRARNMMPFPWTGLNAGPRVLLLSVAGLIAVYSR